MSKKSNFSGGYKLEPITTYQLKMLQKCCENVMDIALLTYIWTIQKPSSSFLKHSSNYKKTLI